MEVKRAQPDKIIEFMSKKFRAAAKLMASNKFLRHEGMENYKFGILN